MTSPFTERYNYLCIGLQETSPWTIRDVEGMITGTISRVVAPLCNEGVGGASTNSDSRY